MCTNGGRCIRIQEITSVWRDLIALYKEFLKKKERLQMLRILEEWSFNLKPRIFHLILIIHQVGLKTPGKKLLASRNRCFWCIMIYESQNW